MDVRVIPLTGRYNIVCLTCGARDWPPLLIQFLGVYDMFLMVARRRVCFFLSLFITCFIPSAYLHASENQPIVKLETLVQEVKENNPGLKAARHQIKAAQAKVRQVTALDPSQIGVEFFQTPVESFPNPARNGMETDYFIQQMFPYPGKLSLMGKTMESNVRMTEEGYKALELRVIRDLKTAYYELYLVQRKIEINAENQSLMAGFTDIALRQYEAGMAKQADVLRAQTELATLVNEGISLGKEKRVVEAMMNTSLGRLPSGQFGYVPEIETGMTGLTFEQVYPLAVDSRPDLKGMQYNIDMSRAEVAVSRREYYPDFMVRLMYKDMADTTDDFWSAMVSINVPLAFWSKERYTSKVDEGLSNVGKAEEEYENMKNMAMFEVQEAIVKIQTNQNLIGLFRNTVIPKAEQTLQSTLAAYQAGKTEFLMVIDASRMLLMTRLDCQMAIMNYMTGQAQLEQAVGMGIGEIGRAVKR